MCSLCEKQNNRPLQSSLALISHLKEFSSSGKLFIFAEQQAHLMNLVLLIFGLLEFNAVSVEINAVSVEISAGSVKFSAVELPVEVIAGSVKFIAVLPDEVSAGSVKFKAV
jgi:hypothetical protein